LVLRKLREPEDFLVSLVRDKNMAGWFNGITTQRAKWGHHSICSDCLVAKGSAFLAGVTNHARSGVFLKGDKVSSPFNDLKLRENSKLQQNMRIEYECE
jgi:hypothetical protein